MYQERYLRGFAKLYVRASHLQRTKMGKIPDGWEKYIPMGRTIEGTRFIAFKVPLQQSFNRILPEDEHFTPDDMLKTLNEMRVNLGVVIDLTNTTRYYRHEDIERHGIGYRKIFCEGHIVPTQTVRDNFFKAVDEFLQGNEDNGDVIGVHCTHGLNRTGYLVCRYMIDRLKFSPDDAIKAFNAARGHDIERQNYLDDLRGIKKTSDSDATSSSSMSPRKRAFAGVDGHPVQKRTQTDAASMAGASTRRNLHTNSRADNCDESWNRSANSNRSSARTRDGHNNVSSQEFNPYNRHTYNSYGYSPDYFHNDYSHQDSDYNMYSRGRSFGHRGGFEFSSYGSQGYNARGNRFHYNSGRQEGYIPQPRNPSFRQNCHYNDHQRGGRHYDGYRTDYHCGQNNS